MPNQDQNQKSTLPVPVSEGPEQFPDLKIPVNPLKEYVSGGQYQYLGAGYARALPIWIDDLTSDFGADIYDRMMFDPKVASNVNVLKLSILSNGVSLVGKIQDKDDPDYDLSQEILEFCKFNLDRLKTPTFSQALWQMLDAIAFGNKVAEIIYETVKTGDWAGKMCLKHIKVKPRRVVAFVVDIYFNVVALIGLLPSYGMTSVITQGLIGIGASVDQADKFIPANILPREKFMIFSFRERDSDPRGTSILRPAYEPWWNKQQTLQEWRRYLAQFAGPSLIGKTPPGAMPVPQTDSYGNIIPNSTPLTPEEILASQLAAFQNGTYIVLPAEASVEPMYVNGDGKAFHEAINYYNTEITQSILNQTLATEDAQANARAASETQQDVMGNVILSAKKDLADTIRQDLLFNLIQWNYGQDIAEKYTPAVSLSGTEHQDFASNAGAIAELWGAQYLSPSQQKGIDAMLNLPERTETAQPVLPPNEPDSKDESGRVENWSKFAFANSADAALTPQDIEAAQKFQAAYVTDGGDYSKEGLLKLLKKLAAAMADSGDEFLTHRSSGKAKALETFRQEMIRLIKMGQLISALYAENGNWNKVAVQDEDAIEASVLDQLQYLDKFIEAVQNNTQNSVSARASLYAKAGYGFYFELKRQQEKAEGKTEERRVMGKAEHCDGCGKEADKGWQPIGTLRPIGDCSCIVQCKCSFEFR